MNTKQIIQEMEKEFDEKYGKVFKETQKPIMNLKSMLLGGDKTIYGYSKSYTEIDIKSFIASYIRTLLESFGEEIMNKLETEIDVVLDSEVVKNANVTRECIDGTFTHTRLKVKEILEVIK